MKTAGFMLMLGVTWCLASSRAQESAVGLQSPVPFKGVARLNKLSSKRKNFEAEVIYPTFRARTRLVRFANSQIGPPQRAAFAAWLQDARRQLSDFQTPAPFELKSAPSLTYYSPSRLISLRFDAYRYQGGAHGISLMETHNFGLVQGKPKKLNLGDLFAPNSGYRRLVETRLFAKLKKNQAAMWVHDGSVKTLSTVQFNRFSIERDGLTWLFDPYEMGPFANGPIEVKLSPRELGPSFLGIPK